MPLNLVALEIKKRKRRFFVIPLIMGLGIFIFGFTKNTLGGKKNYSAQVPVHGKMGELEQGRVEFQWQDEGQGRGTARVILESGVLSPLQQWRFRWILPEGVAMTTSLEGPLSSGAMAQEPRVIEAQLENLNAKVNQNIIVEILPEKAEDKGFSFLIPSNFEKTLEFNTGKQNASPSEEVNSMKVNRPPKGPKGIRF